MRYFRYLRFAWSVFWGVATVLLIVLWVRSYWHWDAAVRGWGVTPQQLLALSSHSGGVSIQYLDARGNSMVSFFRWKITTMPAQDRDSVFTAGLWQAGTGFYWHHGSDGFLLTLPGWFLVPLLIAFAAAPWLHYRFSVRTLLIATTLVAVGLGLIVLLSAKPMDDDNARANENAAAGQVGSYTQGLDSYHTDVKEYPHTLKPLSASAITGWHGPYTRGFAKDPWGHDWMYVAPGKHNPDSYDIWSVGPDGVDGTADDIGNWESK